MSLLVQDGLRDGTITLESIVEKYHIGVKRHGKYPNLVQFKYDQIDSPMGERLVQQCRGLILDEADNWRVIARPFDKFFNEGEGHAAKIDWATARVQEKLDGSLMILYFYEGRWHVAASGTPDASGIVSGWDFTFETLFWRVWKEMGYPEPSNLRGTNYTMMFELMTPYNRIVVDHKQNILTFLGFRRADSVGWEMNPYKEPMQFVPVREFPLYTLEDALRTFDTMDPLQQEGYVIVDKDFNRIKVKHPGYVALHHLISGFSLRRVVELVREGNGDDIPAKFPQYKDVFAQVTEAYQDLIVKVETSFDVHNLVNITQKEFALRVKDLPYSSLLFGLRSGKIKDLRAELKQMPVDRLVRLLGIKETIQGESDADNKAGV